MLAGGKNETGMFGARDLLDEIQNDGVLSFAKEVKAAPEKVWPKKSSK